MTDALFLPPVEKRAEDEADEQEAVEMEREEKKARAGPRQNSHGSGRERGTKKDTVRISLQLHQKELRQSKRERQNLKTSRKQAVNALRDIKRNECEVREE